MTPDSNILIDVAELISRYRKGSLSFQGLVNAVDALRNNSGMDEDKLDEIYIDLETINACRLDEERELDSHDHKQIELLLNSLETEMQDYKVSMQNN